MSDVLQLLQQEKHELNLQLDAALTSSRQAEAEHRADLEDMRHNLDTVESRTLVRQRADQQRIDELMKLNERLSEQLLSVSKCQHYYISYIYFF